MLAVVAALFLSVCTVGGLAGVHHLMKDSGEDGAPPAAGPAADSRDEAGAATAPATENATTESTSPHSDTEPESAEEHEDVRPWVRGFTAGSAELEVGASTTLRLDVRDPRPGDRDWHVEWQSSCGAAAPSNDDHTSAVFLAPTAPGWCRVTATLVEPPRSRTKSAVDILVTPSQTEDL